MPWLRHKRWKYLSPLAPAVTVTASGRRYLCTGAQGGLVAVPYRQDAEDLLNPPGDTISVWEVAWEKHGSLFDAQGKEQVPTPEIPIVVANTPNSAERSVPVESLPKRGRPSKPR